MRWLLACSAVVISHSVPPRPPSDALQPPFAFCAGRLCFPLWSAGVVFPGRAPLRFPSAVRFPGPFGCCCVARLLLPWVLELICDPVVLPVSFMFDLGNRKSPSFGVCDLGGLELPSFGVGDHRSPFLFGLVRPGAWPLDCLCPCRVSGPFSSPSAVSNLLA